MQLNTVDINGVAVYQLAPFKEYRGGTDYATTFALTHRFESRRWRIIGSALTVLSFLIVMSFFFLYVIASTIWPHPGPWILAAGFVGFLQSAGIFLGLFVGLLIWIIGSLALGMTLLSYGTAMSEAVKKGPEIRQRLIDWRPREIISSVDFAFPFFVSLIEATKTKEAYDEVVTFFAGNPVADHNSRVQYHQNPEDKRTTQLAIIDAVEEFVRVTKSEAVFDFDQLREQAEVDYNEAVKAQILKTEKKLTKLRESIA